MVSVAEVAALAANLGHKDLIVRSQAARLLVRLGSQAEPAIPALIQTLEDQNHALADLAAVALGNIGGGAIEPLLQAARSGPVTRRALVLHVLGRYPEYVNQTLSTVASALDDESAAIRCQAGRTLHTLQAAFAESKQAIPEDLSRLLKKTRRVLSELSAAYPDQARSAQLTLAGMDRIEGHTAGGEEY